MAEKLSHPVGIRDRKTNVANKSVDQNMESVKKSGVGRFEVVWRDG
jgi:hypothetical protein